MKSFEDVQNYAKEIQGAYSQRDTTFTEIEDAYLLKEVGMPTQDWIKPTMSPDARNKLLGAARLLTAADPIWSVPRDKNKTTIDEELASKIEKAAAMMWTSAGRIKKQPVHYNATLSALLYGQVEIAPIAFSKLLENEKNQVRRKRLEKISKRTPVTFEVLSPKVSYPVYDAFGLAQHVTYRKMRVVDVISRWGNDAETQLTGKKGTEEVDYNEYWDDEIHAVWISGMDQPLLLEAHELPFIPIASAIVEGGDLFETEFRWQPFLYTHIKSQLHARQSLMLTVMYSNAFAVGANPLLVYEAQDKNSDLVIDYTNPGGVLKILRGESLTPMSRNIIDASFRELFQIAEQKAEESTIYSQTLGEPLGGNAPFSMVSLLSQSGRLPLVPYQRMLSSVITDAMQIAIELLRAEGVTGLSIGSEDAGIDLDLSDVPEDLELQANLGIDMPQDEFTQARIAMEVVKSGLMSIERAREKYLNIGQSDEETKQIYAEKYIEFLAQQQFQMKAMQMQQQQQQQMMMQQGGMMPPGQMPPGIDPSMMQGQPGQMPPGMDQQMMAGMQSAQEGLPMQMPQQPPGMNPEAGLPPEMMRGM